MSEHCGNNISTQNEFCIEVPVTNLKAEPNQKGDVIYEEELKAIDNELSDLMESVERSGKEVKTDIHNDILLETSSSEVIPVIDENKNSKNGNGALKVIKDSAKKKRLGSEERETEIMNDKLKGKDVSKIVSVDEDKRNDDPKESSSAPKSENCVRLSTNKENKNKNNLVESAREDIIIINDFSEKHCSESESTVVLDESDSENVLVIDKDKTNDKQSCDTIMDDSANKSCKAKNTVILNDSEPQNNLVTSTDDQEINKPKKSDSIIIILDENDSSNKNNDSVITIPLNDNEAQNAIVTSTDDKLKKDLTEINTIVLDDDEESTETNTVVIDVDAKDDCTIVEETALAKRNRLKNKVIEYNKIFYESPLLAELIVKCLELKNSEGMLRVINRTLIAIYKNVDNTYKKSRAFNKAVKNAITKLESEPQMKFSHIKNLCDEFKLHRTRKRVSLTTLNKTDEKKSPNIPPKRQTLEAVINLDDDNDENIKKFTQNNRQKPNTIVINVPFEENINDFTYNDVPIQKDVTEPKTYDVPILTDTDNIPIHQKIAPIEIDDDSGSDIVIGDGNYSHDDVILLDESANKNKRKKKTPTKNATKRKRGKPCYNLAANTNNRKGSNHLVFNTDKNETVSRNIQSNHVAKNDNRSNLASRSGDNYTYQTTLQPKETPVATGLLQPLQMTPAMIVEVDTIDSNKQRIKIIEDRIAELKKNIEILEEQEVTDDDVNSPYILCEQFKLNIVRLYKELCKLTGTVAVKRHKVRLQVIPGHPEGPVRCLEKFLNDNIDEHGDPPFPDLQDVVQCVCEANNMHGMMWDKQQIMNEAHALFSQYGRTVQKRRQKREYKDLLSLVKVERVDPAEEDPVLQARLCENSRIARRNEYELLERYANMEKGVIGQPDLGLRIEHSGDSEDSDGNNEEISAMDKIPSEMTTPIDHSGPFVNQTSTVGVETACDKNSWSIVSESSGLISITPKLSYIPIRNKIPPVILPPITDLKLSTGNIVCVDSTVDKAINSDEIADTMEIDIDDFVKTETNISSIIDNDTDVAVDKNTINEETIQISDNLTTEKTIEAENDITQKEHEAIKPKSQPRILLEDISKVYDTPANNIDNTCKKTDLNIPKVTNDHVGTELILTQIVSMQAVVKLNPLNISSIRKATDKRPEDPKTRENLTETGADSSQMEIEDANIFITSPRTENENDENTDKETLNVSGAANINENIGKETLNISGAENITDENGKETLKISAANENGLENEGKQTEDSDVIVKREPLDIPTMLEELGQNYTATIFDIEDPFMVIDISDSSDSEDEHT